MAQELDTLIEQLDELVEEGALDASDALEIAIVGGLCARLGAPASELVDAVAFRDGPGQELLVEAFENIEYDELIAFIESFGPEHDASEIEEGLYDVDEIIAAAIWCGQEQAVRAMAARVADYVRMVPEIFAPLSEDGTDMVRMESVGRHYDLYDFWFAVSVASRAAT